MNTACIYVVAAVAYNLINGITGQFSLGPNGFMAIGGYTVAILMLPLVQKKNRFIFCNLLSGLLILFLSFSSFSFSSFFRSVAAALAALLIGIPLFAYEVIT